MSVALKDNFSFDDLIKKVSQIVAKISGNVLEEKQALMVQTRVKKRMGDLKIATPGEYSAYVDTHYNEESKVLVSLLTTHHTFFFREFAHFEHLKKNLPDLIARVKARKQSKFRIWSAACSRGQEVYSLSMFLNFYLPKIDPVMDYEIYGSDIDSESVAIAKNGVYHKREIKSVPMNYLGDHWARGTGEIAEYVKAKKSLTANLNWKVINLLDFNNDMKGEMFDVIFCRNVFIYFRPEQIKAIMTNFMSHIHPGGLFYSGISESLGSLGLELENVGPSVYTSKDKNDVEIVKSVPKASAPSLPAMPEKLRVLCVDDSPSILTLLKKVFSADGGFEVVATASNGLEAIEMVKKHKFDVMTLDIHMPEMDGVTYLENHYNKSHPPVVMISSASREDSSAAMRALRAGASDFIEKPSLNNLMERGDEIKTKLKVAYMDSKMGPAGHVSSMDRDFEHEINIDRPDDCARIIFSSLPDQKKVEKFYRELHGKQPTTVMFFEGQDNILEAVKNEIEGKIKQKVLLIDQLPAKFESETVYLADFTKMYDNVKSKLSNKKTSILVFGKVSGHASAKVLDWPKPQLLLEDLKYKCELTDVATDIVPATSFAYMSSEFLARK